MNLRFLTGADSVVRHAAGMRNGGDLIFVHGKAMGSGSGADQPLLAFDRCKLEQKNIEINHVIKRRHSMSLRNYHVLVSRTASART